MPKRAQERRRAYALALGILLFSVTMMLWETHETSFTLVGREVSLPWLSTLYKVSGEVLLVVSIVPIVALFSDSVQQRMERFLETRPASPHQAISQFVLWFCTTWIYVLEWTKGLAAVSGQALLSNLLLCFGLFWLAVLFWFFLRPAFQRMLQELRSAPPV